VRILISLNQCENIVAGVPKLPMAKLIRDAVDRLGSICGAGEVSI
jgi:hypothetical protein